MSGKKTLKEKLMSSIFTVTEDDNVAVKENVTMPVTTNNFGTQNTFSTPTVNEFQTQFVGDTQKYRDHFIKLMKEANLPGNDYYELNMTLEALFAAIPDERTRFIAAYTPLSLNGLTKEKVNATAKTYLGKLDEDASNFLTSLEQVRGKEVNGQKQQVENNNKKIQQLTNEIQSLNSENLNINQKIVESEQKISASKAGYEVEFNNWKNAILNNLNKINQYITQ